MSAITTDSLTETQAAELWVFEQIADDLIRQSWSVVPDGLPATVAAQLFAQVRQMSEHDFAEAGIGRSSDHVLNQFVRRDQVRWIEGDGVAEQDWLAWAGRLQLFLNRRLFLGLFSFESHFAHYRTGDFYRKHLDAFRPDGLERGARREVSLVTYLNPGWESTDGGELVIYEGAGGADSGAVSGAVSGTTGEQAVRRVLPAYGTVVVFLSSEIPHEVLPAGRDRYSIAGWFRLNGSVAERPDPPR